MPFVLYFVLYAIRTDAQCFSFVFLSGRKRLGEPFRLIVRDFPYIFCEFPLAQKHRPIGDRSLTINKKAASNTETAGILHSDFFEVRDSGTHSFALPTLAGVAFVLLDELLHLGGGFGTQSDGG